MLVDTESLQVVALLDWEFSEYGETEFSSTCSFAMGMS